MLALLPPPQAVAQNMLPPRMHKLSHAHRVRNFRELTNTNPGRKSTNATAPKPSFCVVAEAVVGAVVVIVKVEPPLGTVTEVGENVQADLSGRPEQLKDTGAVRPLDPAGNAWMLKK